MTIPMFVSMTKTCKNRSKRKHLLNVTILNDLKIVCKNLSLLFWLTFNKFWLLRLYVQKQKRNVSLLFRFQWQKLLEKVLFGRFFVSEYFLLIAEIGNLCCWCSNIVHNDESCWIFFVMLVIRFNLKKVWKTKILPHLPRYLSCLFGLKKLLKLLS